MRIAYCNTEDNRRWLLSHESSLFQLRLENETQDGIASFLLENNMKYEEVVIGSDEHNAVRNDLDVTFRSANPSNKIEASSYFKVPFEEAFDLVSVICIYVCILIAFNLIFY